jgi:hypothetical protein
MGTLTDGALVIRTAKRPRWNLEEAVNYAIELGLTDALEPKKAVLKKRGGLPEAVYCEDTVTEVAISEHKLFED